MIRAIRKLEAAFAKEDAAYAAWNAYFLAHGTGDAEEKRLYAALKLKAAGRDAAYEEFVKYSPIEDIISTEEPTA